MTDMRCPEILRTQAWLDGELDKTVAAEAESHANSCPACEAFVADTAALSDAIHSHAARWTAPLLLRKRIAAATAKDSRRAGGYLRNESFWFGAAGGVALSALAAATVFFLLLPLASSNLVESVTDAHTNALKNHDTIEVVSSNHHTVKPWFAGRVDISPPVADFAGMGFSLAGGRVDRIAGMPSAVVVYQHGLHEIDLFVWADRGVVLPGEAVRHGYRTIFWKSADLDFAAVSDMEPAELRKFVRLVRSAG